MEKGNSNLSSYLENISLVLFGITFIAFPILFLTITTDPYLIPKQTLIAVAVTASLILLGIQMIIEGHLRIRRTPFDLPLLWRILALSQYQLGDREKALSAAKKSYDLDPNQATQALYLLIQQNKPIVIR